MGKRKAQDPAPEEVEEPEEASSEYSDEEEDDSDDDSAPEVSDEEEEDEDDEDGEAFDEVQVDFQFFDPQEKDFHGLKALLHTYLDGQQYDCSGLVDTIIQQPTVGTVVKTGEDEDPIAVMTALSIQRYQEQPFMAQVHDFITSKCADRSIQQKIEKVWKSPGTGLLLNERLVNSPPQIAPPLVQALFDEIQWATEDEPTEALRSAFKFKHYLLLTRVYSDPQGDEPAAAAAAEAEAGPSSSSRSEGMPPPGPRKKHKQQADGSQQQQQQQLIVYVRPEDEFFHQHCSAAFTFPVEGRPVAKDELRPMRLVMLLSADKVPAARAALDAVIGNPAAGGP